jgi:beta-xylosidase
LLSRTASGDTGPNRVIERPKIIYNKSTKKYVMWMHIDSGDYKEAKIGVATGDSVCGKYTYLRSEQPLGHQSRDSGVFVDADDKAYLLTEDVSLGKLKERMNTV